MSKTQAPGAYKKYTPLENTFSKSQLNELGAQFEPVLTTELLNEHVWPYQKDKVDIEETYYVGWGWLMRSVKDDKLGGRDWVLVAGSHATKGVRNKVFVKHYRDVLQMEMHDVMFFQSFRLSGKHKCMDVVAAIIAIPRCIKQLEVMTDIAVAQKWLNEMIPASSTYTGKPLTYQDTANIKTMVKGVDYNRRTRFKNAATITIPFEEYYMRKESGEDMNIGRLILGHSNNKFSPLHKKHTSAS